MNNENWENIQWIMCILDNLQKEGKITREEKINFFNSLSYDAKYV